MSDPIKAALEAAAWAACEARIRLNEDDDEPRCTRPEPCPWCITEATAAIAAFLRALPDPLPLGGTLALTLSSFTRALIAARVERATKGENNNE